MSFRKFGGLQYAAKHNIVSSNYNTANNLTVIENVGQSNSFINFESDIHLNGNLVILPTGPTGSSSNNGIYFPDGSFQNTAGGASSSVTGPTGAASSVTGPTGATSSVTGPTGAASSVTGPTGAESSVTGPTGPPYSLIFPSPTGSYTYMNASVNDYGQVTSASSTKYPNTLRYVISPSSPDLQYIYTFTIPVGTFTTPLTSGVPTGWFFNWWFITGYDTLPMNGVISTDGFYNAFLPSQIGYNVTFGDIITTINIHSCVATGVGICGGATFGSPYSIICPSFIKQFEYGTNPIVSIEPTLTMVSSVPTYTITFTLTTAIYNGAMLYIQPLSANSYPREL